MLPITRTLAVILVLFVAKKPLQGQTGNEEKSMSTETALMITKKFENSLSALLKYHIRFSYTMLIADDSREDQLKKLDPTKIASITTISQGNALVTTDRHQIEDSTNRLKRKIESAAKSSRFEYDLACADDAFSLTEGLSIIDNKSQHKDFQPSCYHNSKSFFITADPATKTATVDVPVASFPTVVRWTEFMAGVTGKTFEQLIKGHRITIRSEGSMYIVSAKDSYKDAIAQSDSLGEVIIQFAKDSLNPLSLESYRTINGVRQLFYRKTWTYDRKDKSLSYLDCVLPSQVKEETFENGATVPTQTNLLQVEVFEALEKPLNQYVVPDGYAVFDKITNEQFIMGKKSGSQ